MKFTGIERQLNILDYALHSLARRPGRHLSITFIFALVIFLVASFQMVTASLKHSADVLLKTAPEITVQKMVAGRQVMMRVGDMARVGKVFGIKEIYPRVWGYHFAARNGANYTIIGLDPARQRQLPPYLDGVKMPLAPGEAIVGLPLAKLLDLGGRRVFSLARGDLSLKSFRLAGTFPAASDILTGDLLVTNIADARDLLGMKADEITDICVSVANPAEVRTIAGKISRVMPGTRVLTRDQIRKTYQAVFSWRSGFGSICLLTALAAFFILAWDRASGLSAGERRETAILKVLGWQTTDIITLRFWEGGAVATMAFLLGVMAAWLHVTIGAAALFRPVLMGWSVLRPNLELVPVTRVSDFIIVFTFTVLPYLAATVIPAWHSATVPPDAAVR